MAGEVNGLVQSVDLMSFPFRRCPNGNALTLAGEPAILTDVRKRQHLYRTLNPGEGSW